MILLDGVTANGPGAVHNLPLSQHGPTVRVRRYMVAAWGTFGGGTVAMQISPDGGTSWIDAATFTADGIAIVEIGKVKMRGDVTGATSPAVSLRVFG